MNLNENYIQILISQIDFNDTCSMGKNGCSRASKLDRTLDMVRKHKDCKPLVDAFLSECELRLVKAQKALDKASKDDAIIYKAYQDEIALGSTIGKRGLINSSKKVSRAMGKVNTYKNILQEFKIYS